MAESNKMKEMPVNKLMVQMGIPMILSMALQAVYNIVDSAFVGNMRVDAYNKKEVQIAKTEHRNAELLPKVSAHGRVIIGTS